MRILLIEDSAPLRETLAAGLGAQGFFVDACADGDAGWLAASTASHDLVILDRMLPGLDGLEILRRLRRAGSRVPVLLLTARDAVSDRVEGLDAGADDYLSKPFAAEELLARIRALLRRGHPQNDPVTVVLDLEVDTASRSARRCGRRLDLTAREYALLECLLQHQGTLVTRPELGSRLGHDGEMLDGNAVEALISRLRRKLDTPGCRPLLHTRRGFGYILAAEPA